MLIALIGMLQGLPAGPALLHVFVGHALGNVAFTPLARLILRERGRVGEKLADGRTAAEALALIGLVIVTSLLVFGQSRSPLLFLPMLPIILVSFRLGNAGAALAVAIVAIIGGVATLAGLGPIVLLHEPVGEQLQFFQLYLACLVVTALPVAADLENRAKLHRALRLSEERYRLFAEHSTDILLHLDEMGRIRYVSPSIRQLGGYDPESLIGTNSSALVAPDHIARVREGHQATIAARGGTKSFDYLALTKQGDQRWFESHTRAIVDDRGRIDGVLCVVRDISAQKEREQQLSRAALTDALTGLPNRRAFEAAVAQRVADRPDAEGDCIALFDIDRFKRVNDTYGHAAGDAVLRRFARVMQRVVRSEDVIARVGGEEFAILFPQTIVPHALLICDRLRTQMSAVTTTSGGRAIQVTISGGVALLGPGGLTRALKEADRALYCAKRGGRDQMALAA